MPVVTSDNVLLEAAEERGEAGAAAKSDDAKPVGETSRFCVALRQGMACFSE
jgi:hypothetical protein